jgi:hypothetical protein
MRGGRGSRPLAHLQALNPILAVQGCVLYEGRGPAPLHTYRLLTLFWMCKAVYFMRGGRRGGPAPLHTYRLLTLFWLCKAACYMRGGRGGGPAPLHTYRLLTLFWLCKAA